MHNTIIIDFYFFLKINLCEISWKKVDFCEKYPCKISSYFLRLYVMSNGIQNKRFYKWHYALCTHTYLEILIIWVRLKKKKKCRRSVTIIWERANVRRQGRWKREHYPTVFCFRVSFVAFISERKKNKKIFFGKTFTFARFVHT